MVLVGVASLVTALGLAAVYVLGPRIRPVNTKHSRRWLSLAAGASVAYVFVDILPELGARNRGLVTAAYTIVLLLAA